MEQDPQNRLQTDVDVAGVASIPVTRWSVDFVLWPADLVDRSVNFLRRAWGRRGRRGGWLLLLIWVIGGIPAIGAAQDDVEVGKEALGNKSYPWYDANQDKPKRMDFKERAPAESSNRDNIPMAAPRRATQTNTGSSGMGDLSVMGWIGLAVLISFIIGVLIWAVLHMGSDDPELEDLPLRTMADSIKQLPFEMDTTTGDFRKLAQNAYAIRDYRRAIIFLFSHVLVSLDQKNLIRLRKGKTNRQYLGELKNHRALANYYQRVMVPFEATFFGDHDLEQQDFEGCWDLLDGFQANVDQSTQVANV